MAVSENQTTTDTGVSSKTRGILMSIFGSKAQKRQPDDLRLQNIKNIIATLPEGKALLDFADQHPLHLSLDNKMSKNHNGNFGWDTEQQAFTIQLNARKTDAELVNPLVHELRHLWQHTQLGITPGQTFALPHDAALDFTALRVMEADAFTYAQHFCVRLHEQGITEPLTADLKDKHHKKTPLITTRDTIKTDATAKQDALTKTFDFYLQNFLPSRYDSGHLATMFSQILNNKTDNAVTRQASDLLKLMPAGYTKDPVESVLSSASPQDRATLHDITKLLDPAQSGNRFGLCYKIINEQELGDSFTAALHKWLTPETQQKPLQKPIQNHRKTAGLHTLS